MKIKQIKEKELTKLGNKVLNLQKTFTKMEEQKGSEIEAVTIKKHLDLKNIDDQIENLKIQKGKIKDNANILCENLKVQREEIKKVKNNLFK